MGTDIWSYFLKSPSTTYNDINVLSAKELAEDIPPFCTHFTPLTKLIVFIYLGITLALNIYGDVSLDYQVSLRIHIAGTNYDNYVYDVSVFQTAYDLWDIGAYWLALFIYIWSVVWPYVKWLMLFSMWFLPIPHKWFTPMLYLIETFGKWALIDYFVVVFGLVVLTSELSLGEGKDLYVEVLCEIKSGMYAFVIAMYMLLFLTSVISNFHRSFSSERVYIARPTARIQYWLLFLCLAAVSLFAPTWLLSTTELKAQIEPIIDDHYEFSVYDIIEGLFPGTDNYVFFNLISGFVLVVIFPIAQLLLLCGWSLAYSLESDIYTSYGMYIDAVAHELYVWSCLDICAVSFILCALNIEDLVEYLDEEIGIGITMQYNLSNNFYVYVAYCLVVYAIILTLKVLRFGWWFCSSISFDESRSDTMLQNSNVMDDEASYNSFVNNL